jgi:hypothetical protein
MQTGVLRKFKDMYLPFSGRKDDLEVILRLLLEVNPSDLNWTEELNACQEYETEAFQIIAKGKKLIINYLLWNDLPSLEISFECWIQLSKDIKTLIKECSPQEVVIMREKGQYFIKDVHSSVAFRRQAQGKYVLSVFGTCHELGALAKFLWHCKDFEKTINWLQNTKSQEIIIEVGKLRKYASLVIIEYLLEPGLEMSSQIPIFLLSSLIEKYIFLLSINPEELLFISRENHLSFMTNPHEEIKLEGE